MDDLTTSLTQAASPSQGRARPSRNEDESEGMAFGATFASTADGDNDASPDTIATAPVLNDARQDTDRRPRPDGQAETTEVSSLTNAMNGPQTAATTEVDAEASPASGQEESTRRPVPIAQSVMTEASIPTQPTITVERPDSHTSEQRGQLAAPIAAAASGSTPPPAEDLSATGSITSEPQQPQTITQTSPLTSGTTNTRLEAIGARGSQKNQMDRPSVPGGGEQSQLIGNSKPIASEADVRIESARNRPDVARPASEANGPVDAEAVRVAPIATPERRANASIPDTRSSATDVVETARLPPLSATEARATSPAVTGAQKETLAPEDLKPVIADTEAATQPNADSEANTRRDLAPNGTLASVVGATVPAAFANFGDQLQRNIYVQTSPVWSAPAAIQMGAVESALAVDPLAIGDLGLTASVGGLSQTQTAVQLVMPGHAPPATAQAVAQQIAAALSDPTREQSGPVELALDPPELGRVRMQVAEIAGVMTLTIHAERPETADLMRRHLDLLSEEFADQGLDAPSVRISQDGGSDTGSDGRPDEGDSRYATGPEDEPDPMPQNAADTHRALSNGALDLRL